MREGWEIKKLGEVCKTFTDGDWIESKDQAKSGIRLIQTGNIGNGIFKDKDEHYKFISNDTFEELSCTEIFEGDILISRLPEPIGRACIIPSINYRMITAVDCTIVRPNESILSKYLIYYTRSKEYYNNIKTYITGAVRKRISRANLAKVSVPIPLLPEQQKIVDELDCLSNMIELKKKQLETYDKLAQSIFYDMFGDPITNEKGWEVRKLEDLCDISSSKRIFANEYTDSGIPFYRGKEITEKSKGSEISIELYISPERYNEIKENYGVPQMGDILLTAVGTIGNMWVVNTSEPFYFKDGNILWIKLKTQSNPVFFKELLNILISNYKAQMANGCAYNALTIVNLKQMPTSIIPHDLQQQFAEKIEAVEKHKELIKQTLKGLEELFNSRMDYYFN